VYTAETAARALGLGHEHGDQEEQETSALPAVAASVLAAAVPVGGRDDTGVEAEEVGRSAPESEFVLM
jgi:hypothetical protein